MARLREKIKGRQEEEYLLLPTNDDYGSPQRKQRSRLLTRKCRTTALATFATVLSLYGLLSVLAVPTAEHIARDKSCDTVKEGYRCSPEISHFWGQYSLWFQVPSEIDVDTPNNCDVTFASVLSRHGGRDPTASKTIAYGATIGYIQNTSASFPDEYAFLKDYKFNLGADQLTDAGRQEMVNSGAHFYKRYKKFLKGKTPFVRSSGQDRVVESANKWLAGYADKAKQDTPAPIDLVIPEGAGINNTLSHEICTNFEVGALSEVGDKAQADWIPKFVPSIQARVNSKLGTNLSTVMTIYLMDMCPFDTLTSPTAAVSPFCGLFTEAEWHSYDYYQSLGKYYGYGNGNPLGPTQGVGYVNELLARLTERPVDDHTNTNRTLDSNPDTFPLNRKVYADFSHDNDMTAIFAALGLYNTTSPLSTTSYEDNVQTKGYSAAWTVPFAARMYVEKLWCKNTDEERVRIIVNDRVLPLEFCGGDEDGMCRLSKFVDSQNFARSGGLWDQCFT